MNKNKKYILIALLASLLFTVTIGFSVWIILSEQARGHIQKMGEISFAPTLNSPTATYYAGEAAPFSYEPVVYSYYYNGESTPRQWEITGTAEINTLVGKGGALTDGALDTECEITFRPTSTFAQWLWGKTITATVTVKLLPVAQNGDVYYTTVDKALEGIQNASSGTVNVLPTDYDTEINKAVHAKTIHVSAKIPSGVTLALQHVSGAAYDVSSTAETRNTTYRQGTESSYSDETLANTKKYLMNSVTLGENVKLTVQGTLVIGGVLGNDAQSYSGHTSGSYAQLMMTQNSQIDSTGTIDCLGFIKKAESNTECSITATSGSIYTPFVIYDYRGGSYTVGIYRKGKVVPFKQYDVPNVQVKSTIHSTATLFGYADLYTGAVSVGGTQVLKAQHNLTMVKLISSSGAVINLGGGSSAIVEYTPKDKMDGNWGKYTTKYGTTTIDLYGNASLGSMKMSVSVAGKTADVETSSVYFPIPWNYTVNLHSGTHTIAYKAKFMSGATVNVGADATLNLNANIVFYPKSVASAAEDTANTFFDDATVDGTTVHFASNRYPARPAATLNVSGKVYVSTAVGGTVYASASGAYCKADASGAVVSKEGAGDVSTSDMAKLLFDSNAEVGTFWEEDSISMSLCLIGFDEVTYQDVGTYYSGEKDEKYAWYSADMTVTFMANGAVHHLDDFSASQEGYTGIIPEPSKPTRNYHTFSHWCKMDGCTADKACTKQIDVTTYQFFNTITLYAAWTPNIYSIAFDANGGTFGDGTTSQSFSTQYGAKYNLPTSNPTRIGYTFAGWESGGSAITADTIMTKEAHTVTAQWQGKTYTVTLNAGDGGTFEGEATPSTTVTFGSKYGHLPTPTRDGYVLVGWKLDETTVIAADTIAETLVSTAGDHTLIAVWEELTDAITVTLSVNGQTSVKEFNVGSTLPQPDNVPQHYTFDYWYKEEGTPLESPYTLAEEDDGAVFYAQFKPNQYTVTYNPAGGEITDGEATVTVTYGSNSNVTLPTATRKGYTFKGWYTAASGGTPIGGAGASYELEANITLYAQWIEQYTVTYNFNNGTGTTTSETKDKGEQFTLPTPDDRTGYTFLGWYPAATGGTSVGGAGASYTPSGNATLYAQWERIVYTITVSTNNATVNGVTNGQTAYYGDTITFTVTYSGDSSKTTTVTDANGNKITTTGSYTFTMPASNVTINATSSSSCIAAGTLITLADGTQKKVEDLTMDDLLLVFNHETGRYEAAAITFIEDDGWDYYNVINLVFSDGTVTKLIYEHALFDLTLNKYVYITEQNYADFVGHAFAVQDGDTFGRVTLTEAFVEREYTGCYSLVTAYHLNYLIDGLFSIPGGIDGLFNIFEYGDDLKYDEEKMNADIHEFGLFTYEEFASYYPEIPVEVYEMFPAKYFKVSIGKGMLTFEDISSYIEQFLIKNGII